MANGPKLLSGRVPVTSYDNLPSDRYQFLNLSDAEPSLGAGDANTVLTLTTGNTRTWSNSITITSLAVTTSANLGNVGNIYIGGGDNGSVLSTDGNGNLSWSSSPSVTQIQNGNSNVSIPDSSGNIYINANAGSDQQWVFDTDGNLSAPSDIVALGNITATSFTANSGVVDFSTTSNVALGDVANVHIGGGAASQVLSTDGNGNLSWQTPSSGGGMPYFIPINTIYTVPLYVQGLFNLPITIEGTLEVDGILVQV